ncbi:sugar ABC transporter permease [Nocardioides donggukensis]|uniref:Xylose transport system permease protein XylH n=1 Tax=Nocardioides donggukensis TaxID=2774019 RepID=A0A927K2X8_9ACTN|nr:sugar ABC transporter permease [Nocardioides donggukensis]MBD8868578.1 sugar ABC transporter permease [Nocardioides donggukensis]
MSETPTTEAPAEQSGPALADLQDERLINQQSFSAVASQFVHRLRGGELGSLPVIIGLIIICTVFYAIEPRFLSSFNLVSIARFAAPTGIISLGIVLVLLLGEIDLSVGSLSGFASAVMAVVVVDNGQPVLVGMAAGIAVGATIGLFFGLLRTRIGVPSFVFSLAGLLAFQGALFYVLGDKGTITIPASSSLVQFAKFGYVPAGLSYLLVLLIAAAYLGAELLNRSRRAKAGLANSWLPLPLVKAGLLAGGLVFLTYYLNVDRGWPNVWALFTVLVVVTDLVLRKTRWGRHVFAVGGNEEAARRSGIKVDRTYVTVFVLCSSLAALGGLMAAGVLGSVSQNSGTTGLELTAIAAAVIGGASLFGGRGTAYAAMLGIIVLQSIDSGLNQINVDSSVRFMTTGAVLLLAVMIDSVSRKARTSSGRG